MFSSCLVYGKPVWIISDLVYEADLIFAPLLAFESSTLCLSYLPPYIASLLYLLGSWLY